MIQAYHLYFSYTGSPPCVLNGIDLEIQDGEYISVMGENGCGKSTLIRLILGFLKPTEGTVITGTKKVGYVPQKSDFVNSGFPITVGELLNSYRRLLKIKKAGAADQALGLVGMRPYRNALIGTLSGGQQQKVLIARALMGNPDLLILDEPSTGVDLQGQKEIYGFLSRLNQNKGITIVSVEHNLDAAINYSTQIYHLANGKGHFCTPEKYADEFLKLRRRDA